MKSRIKFSIKRSTSSALVLFLLFCLFSIDGYGQARRPSILDGNEFFIKSQHSQKNLSAARNAPATNLIQTGSATKDEVFKFEAAGSSSFRIKHMTTGLFITLQPNTGNVVLRKQKNSESQQWKCTRISRGVWKFQSLANDHLLHIKNGSKANQANVIASKTGNVSQSFRLIPSGQPSGNPSPAPSMITIFNEYCGSAYVAVVNLTKNEVEVGRIITGETKSFPQSQVSVGQTLGFYPVNYINEPVDLSNAIFWQPITTPDEYIEVRELHTEGDITGISAPKILSSEGNRFAYDVRKIDPVDLVSHQGRTRAIIDLDFDCLGYKPVPQVEASVPDFFEYHPKNYGDSEIKTTVYGNDREFTKSFSFGASASIGTPSSPNSIKVLMADDSSSADPALGVSASGGFSRVRGFSRSTRSVYITNSALYTKYMLTIEDNADLPLTYEFIRAIKALPKAYNYTAYKDFIEEWGTHYARSVLYGGKLYKVFSMTYDYAMEHEHKEWNLGIVAKGQTAQVAGSVGVNFGGATDQEIAEFNQSTEEHEAYYGGEFNNWNNYSVTEANVEPVQMDLRPLSSLLVPRNFRNQISASELAIRKTNLGKAIDRVIEEAAESIRNREGSRFFNMEFVNLEVMKNHKRADQKIYGLITGVDDKYTDVFNRGIDKPILLNDDGLEKSFIDFTDGEFKARLFQMKVPPGETLAEKEMKIIPDLLEIDRRNLNHFGRKTTTLPLSDFPLGKQAEPQEIDYNNKKALDIKIRYRTWEIDLRHSKLSKWLEGDYYQ